MKSSSPYPAPTGCIDADLGARATQALGHEPPAAVAAHVATCPACQLQETAFTALDAHAASPPPGLRGRLRRAAIERLTRRL